MRVVPNFEKKKRGCDYCKDKQRIRSGGQIRTGCPHDECPYNVLGKYDTYEDFMASEDSMILVNEFFYSAPSLCEHVPRTNSPKMDFSDGDSRIEL